MPWRSDGGGTIKMSFGLDSLLFAGSSGAFPRKEPSGGGRYATSRSGGSLASSGFHSQQSWSRSSTVAASGGGYRRLGGPAGALSQLGSSTESLESSLNGDLRARNEKEVLQALNDRFAGYIDKVRQLEVQNRQLEAEAAALRQQQAGRSAIGELYEREIRDMRGALVQLGAEKGQLALEQDHLEEDIAHLKQRLDDEARQREEVDAAARALAKFADEAHLAKGELEKKLQALRDESLFLRRSHEDEVAELLQHIQGAGGVQVALEARDAALKADVTSALKEIRAQLEGHTVKSTLQSEEWFRGERPGPGGEGTALEREGEGLPAGLKRRLREGQPDSFPACPPSDSPRLEWAVLTGFCGSFPNRILAIHMTVTPTNAGESPSGSLCHSPPPG